MEIYLTFIYKITTILREELFQILQKTKIKVATFNVEDYGLKIKQDIVYLIPWLSNVSLDF